MTALKKLNEFLTWARYEIYAASKWSIMSIDPSGASRNAKVAELSYFSLPSHSFSVGSRLQ